MSDERRTLPIIPLNTVLFPGMTLPLRIFEPRYVQMVQERIKGDPRIGVTLIKEGQEVGGPAVPHEVGTVARIIGVEKKGRGVLLLTTVGEQRFRVRRIVHDKPYITAEVEMFPLRDVHAPEVGVLVNVQVTLLAAYMELLSQVSNTEIHLQRIPESPEDIAYLVAMLLQMPLSVKQRLLSIASLPAMLREEVVMLRSEIVALTVMLRGWDIVKDLSMPFDFSLN